MELQLRERAIHCTHIDSNCRTVAFGPIKEIDAANLIRILERKPVQQILLSRKPDCALLFVVHRTFPTVSIDYYSMNKNEFSELMHYSLTNAFRKLNKYLEREKVCDWQTEGF